MRIPSRPGRTLVVVVVVVLWGLITHGTYAGSGDEPHYLIAAHSLAFDGDLDLANNYRDALLITGGTPGDPELHARLHDGRLRPVHDIGLPLLFAPVVRVTYTLAETLGGVLPPAVLNAAKLHEGLLFRHQISLVMALLAGLLARELFLLFRDLSDRPRAAFWCALLFVLSPPILSHAFLFFTEVPTALLTLVLFRRLTVRPLQQPGAAVLAGLAAGGLLLIHARNIGIVIGLLVLVAMAWQRRTMPRGACATFVAGVAIGVVARTAVTYSLWRTLVTTPHAALGGMAADLTMAGEMVVRVTGLLFDREYGLFAYAPVYLLAAAGLVVMRRRWAHIWTPVMVVLAAYLVPVLLPPINTHGWQGGWSPAARFLVPIAPLLAVAAYAFVLHGPRRLVVAVAAVQAAINAFVWQFPKTLWNDGDGTSAFRLAQWLPSWSEPSPFAPAVFTALVVGLMLFSWKVAERARTPHERARHPAGAG